MFDDPRDDLSEAERRAFAALPREGASPPELEERTVALLRSRGVLPIPLETHRRTGAQPHRRPWLVGVAAAAAVAVFASGLAVGQYLGARNAVMVVQASRSTSAAEITAHVQRAGSLYVAALTSLSRLPDSAKPAVRDSVRTVALRVLGEAAQELVLLAPDDPLAAAVLRGINQRSRLVEPTAASRSVVWY